MYRIIPAILFIIACGCGQKFGPRQGEMTAMTFASEDASQVSQVSQVSRSIQVSENLPPVPEEGKIYQKKIIRDGSLSLESRNLEASRKILDSLVQQYQGYVSSENFNDQGNQLNLTLTCRIPAEKFDVFITDIENGPDKVKNKNINSNDVSEQYYDIKTRLENERQVEKRYLELLGRASTVKDILDIEENLGKIRQEIESKEGRLRYLDDRINYSTLTVWIYQKKETGYEPAERDRFGKRLIQSLHKGWQGLVDVVLFLIKLWPLWLAGILLWRFIAWIGRRRKQPEK
jgi:hypothetical protein